jgi:hypothetical protein
MLKLTVDSLDGLDAPVAALYTKQDDGKFKLGVDGLPDVTKLNSALEAERTAAATATKAAKKAADDAAALVKSFEGLGDPTELRKMVAHLQGSEEARLIAEGKIDEVVKRRTEKFQTEAQRQVTEATDAAKAALQARDKWTQRVMDNAVREAATRAGLHPQAVEDALLHARTIFTLDNEGAAVQLGSDGKPVLGKDGSTPFSPFEWLESMREKRPHWFPATASGSGARQSDSAPAPKGSIKRSAYEALSPAEKSKAAMSGVQIVD